MTVESSCWTLVYVPLLYISVESNCWTHLYVCLYCTCQWSLVVEHICVCAFIVHISGVQLLDSFVCVPLLYIVHVSGVQLLDTFECVPLLYLLVEYRCQTHLYVFLYCTCQWNLVAEHHCMCAFIVHVSGVQLLDTFICVPLLCMSVESNCWTHLYVCLYCICQWSLVVEISCFVYILMIT